MDQDEVKEQKWGFWLLMLNFFSLDSIIRFLFRRMLNISETSIIQDVISSAVALGLTFAIKHALRRKRWKVKVWTSVIIVTTSIVLYIAKLMLRP
jgi:O-antigen/teichoic acid export membrane protein